VVVADINGTEAERVAGDLGSAVAAEVDVSDEPSVVRMVETAVDSFGGLDVLHNNATDSSTNAVDTDIVSLDMAVFDRRTRSRLWRGRDHADGRAGSLGREVACHCVERIDAASRAGQNESALERG
jgi:hypothetical protein